MAKKDETGSGLRAGFSRKGKEEAPEKKPVTRRKAKPETATKQPDVTAPAEEKPVEATPVKEEPAASPTITMQGVSGKKITGVVKVVKKSSKKPIEPEETKETADETLVPAVDKVVAAKEPAAAAAAAAAAKEEIKTAPVEKVSAEAEAPAKETPAPAEPKAAPKEEPAPAVQVPRPFVEKKPLEDQRGPRLIRRAPPPPVAPVQPAKQEERPRSRPAPQTSAPDQSSTGNGPPRVQSGRGPSTRDGGGRPGRKDESREIRKPAARNTEPAFDSKHAALKKQAMALPEEGLSEAIKNDTILDTIYTSPQRRGNRNRGGRRKGRGGSTQASHAAAQRAILTNVTLPEDMTVKEFAEAIKKTTADVIKHLMKMGVMATVNQVIDFDTAEIIASEFGITAEKAVVVTEEDILFDDSGDEEENLVPRPPVVVVMGHVDHGKTSLLDRIRSTSVAEGEAGGITQHIGAYMVPVSGRSVTFLDTPGHEAFTTMRARGAQATDIAILVVAADDGVMPQTIEAINHAKAANTQIVVAINKIDLPGANLDRVKQELSVQELISEEWGGNTIMVPVSAMTGEGIDELLEMLILTADIMDLKADPDKQAKGTVIEAKLDRNRGAVATVLVQRGTLNTGDSIVTGSVIGRVRAMNDYTGAPIKSAGPSTPVEILGMPEVPEAGELFYAITDEKVARNLADRRKAETREQGLRQSSRMSLESLYTRMSSGEVKEVNLIVKADVQGSVEAVRQSLEKLSNDEVHVHVIHGAVGAITESDVRLADVADAIIIGFNVRPAGNVAEMAEEHGVDLRMYRIIYNAIEDVEAAMKGMLEPEYKEVILGHAEVRQVFRVTGAGTIGGCYVKDGRIRRSAEVRVVRDGVVVHEGKLASLKRFKDDAREVATGFECGVGIERFNDLKEGDVIEAFEMQEIERS